MSKEEYADETQRHVSYYHKGKKKERERIIKLIDSKIEEHEKEKITKDYYGRMPTAFNSGYFKALEELKEELEKK